MTKLNFAETVIPFDRPFTLLDPYCVKGDPELPTVLVFAATSRGAKNLGALILMEEKIIEKRLEAECLQIHGNWPYRVIDKNFTKKNVDHVVYDKSDLKPLICCKCGWWAELNRDGLCEDCYTGVEKPSLPA